MLDIQPEFDMVPRPICDGRVVVRADVAPEQVVNEDGECEVLALFSDVVQMAGEEVVVEKLILAEPIADGFDKGPVDDGNVEVSASVTSEQAASETAITDEHMLAIQNDDGDFEVLAIVVPEPDASEAASADVLDTQPIDDDRVDADDDKVEHFASVVPYRFVGEAATAEEYGHCTDCGW